MQGNSGRWTIVGLSGAILLVSSSEAQARPTGEPQACGNCHYKMDGPNIELGFGNDSPDVDETTSVTVDLEAVDGEALRTGVFITTNGVGAFTLLEPDSTRYPFEDDPSAVVHSQPRDLDGEGRASFAFEWTAPSQPGVAEFTVWSMTGNSNGASDDDHHATITVSIAHGCDGVYYYPDNDGDGFGDEAGAELSCEPIAGMIKQGGDCNDGDATVNPDGVEICNSRDDDCDGQFDNGLAPGLYYPDTDGDGYADGTETAEYTCNDAEGYTQELGDCDTDDPDIYPGAPERPNGQDDDCDGEIDEDIEDSGTGGGDEGGDATGTAGTGTTPDAGAAGQGGGCRVAPTSGGLASLYLLSLAALSRRRRRRNAMRG